SQYQAQSLLFPATAQRVATMQGTYSSEMLQSEPALFSADMDCALSFGGPITRAVLRELLKDPYVKAVYEGKVPGHQIIIDSRVHTLKKGEIPAIPGWHTDVAERTAANNMQPSYSVITPSVRIYIINLSDQPEGVSN